MALYQDKLSKLKSGRNTIAASTTILHNYDSIINSYRSNEALIHRKMYFQT